MAQSSIHIDPAKVSYLAHNTRKSKTVNSIFDDEENFYSSTFEEAVKMYRSELAARSAAYSERTGKKLHAKTVTMMSAVVNLNQHHTEDDLKKIVDYLEESLDTKVVNYAIHRDEGHIDKDGNAIKNYHAHITFLGLDSTGASVRRKLTRSYLSELQDKTAELLEMERGINYAKERKRRPKRLDTYEYKRHAEERAKAVEAVVDRSKKAVQIEREAIVSEKEAELSEARAKVKDLSEENKRIRAELRANGAQREQYAQLEATVREMKQQIKDKDLTISQLQQTMAETEASLKAQIKALKRENERLKDENRTLTLESGKNALKTQYGDILPTKAKDRLSAIIAEEEIKEAVAYVLSIASPRPVQIQNITTHYLGFGDQAPDTADPYTLNIADRAWGDRFNDDDDLEFYTPKQKASYGVFVAIEAINRRLDDLIAKIKSNAKDLFETVINECATVHREVQERMNKDQERETRNSYTYDDDLDFGPGLGL